MISGHIQEEYLQQLYDGELSDTDESEARQHLQICEQCRQRLNRLDRLHDMVNLAAEEMATGVDFEALYGRISEGVHMDHAPAGEPVSLMSWRDRLRDSGAHVWVPMAIAAAALIGFVAQISMPEGGKDIRQAGKEPAEKTMVANAPGNNAIHYPAMDGKREEQPPNSEISQVDFGESSGTLFEIALTDGVSTPVVWINDELQDTVTP